MRVRATHHSRRTNTYAAGQRLKTRRGRDEAAEGREGVEERGEGRRDGHCQHCERKARRLARRHRPCLMHHSRCIIPGRGFRLGCTRSERQARAADAQPPADRVLDARHVEDERRKVAPEHADEAAVHLI